MSKELIFNTKTFETKDFWLAGSLLATGQKLIRLDWRDGRAYFIFENSQKCEELEQAYWSGDLKVSAKAFTDALRTLKDRLYGNVYDGNRSPKFTR